MRWVDEESGMKKRRALKAGSCQICSNLTFVQEDRHKWQQVKRDLLQYGLISAGHGGEVHQYSQDTQAVCAVKKYRQ